MRRPRRYTVREISDNRCVLTDHGTDAVTEYWMPTSGGYVRDVTRQPGTLGRQVCDGLRGTGSTLTCHARLVDVIRREARVAYRESRDW